MALWPQALRRGEDSPGSTRLNPSKNRAMSDSAGISPCHRRSRLRAAALDARLRWVPGVNASGLR